MIRDASGTMIGTATTTSSGGSTTRTQYRDISGRLTGNETTNGSPRDHLAALIAMPLVD